MVGKCILYTGIRLLLLIHPFSSSFFFLSNFQTLKFFVTLFSRTVRPRRLKLGKHVDSGQMYRVYRNQAAAACSSFIYSFSFSPIFKQNFSSHLCHHTVRPRRLELGTWKVDGCMVYTGIRLLLLIHPLMFYFLFSPVFKH